MCAMSSVLLEHYADCLGRQTGEHTSPRHFGVGRVGIVYSLLLGPGLVTGALYFLGQVTVRFFTVPVQNARPSTTLNCPAFSHE